MLSLSTFDEIIIMLQFGTVLYSLFLSGEQETNWMYVSCIRGLYSKIRFVNPLSLFLSPSLSLSLPERHCSEFREGKQDQNNAEIHFLFIHT